MKTPFDFEHDSNMMVICAFRYCLGRRTYVVGDCVDWLIHIWPQLNTHSRFIIERDLREEIARDDRSRESGSDYLPLGMDCDREDWLRLLRHIESFNEENQ